MKLKLFLLLCCLQMANASVLSQQRYDVSFKDEAMLEVLNSLRTQTGYQFFYLERNMAAADRVTLSMTQATLPEILDKVLKSKGFTYEIQDKIVIIKVADEEKRIFGRPNSRISAQMFMNDVRLLR